MKNKKKQLISRIFGKPSWLKILELKSKLADTTHTLEVTEHLYTKAEEKLKTYENKRWWVTSQKIGDGEYEVTGLFKDSEAAHRFAFDYKAKNGYGNLTSCITGMKLTESTSKLEYNYGEALDMIYRHNVRMRSDNWGIDDYLCMLDGYLTPHVNGEPQRGSRVHPRDENSIWRKV